MAGRHAVVDPDQSEISAALVQLEGLPLDGAIISVEAIYCQCEIGRQIRDSSGLCMLVVKDDQHALEATIVAIAARFAGFSPLSKRARKNPLRRLNWQRLCPPGNATVRSRRATSG